MQKTSPRRTGLRIGIIIDDFYPSSGGLARSVQVQIEALVRQGHSVTLFAPDYHFTPDPNCTNVRVPHWRIPGDISHLCTLVSTEKIARELCSQYPLDVVHSQTERGGLLLAARIARLQGIPHVHTFHANLAGTYHSLPILSTLTCLTFNLIMPPLLRRAAQKPPRAHIRTPEPTDNAREWVPRRHWRLFGQITSYVDAFTAPSQFMVQAIKTTGTSTTSAVIPTGISPAIQSHIANAKREKSTSLRFISVGRLSPEKRCDVIIRAFAKADITGSELILVGSGPEKVRLRQLAHRLAPGRIMVTGHVDSQARIASYLVNADAFVLASHRFDSQGIVVVEAVAAGLPVLYCDDQLDTGLTPESALLTEPDVDSLAVGMRRLADTRLRRRMSQAAAKLIPELSVDTMNARYVALYRQLRK